AQLNRKRRLQDTPEEDEKPRSQSIRKRRIEEEEEPRSKPDRKRRIQDESDEDEPRPRKKKRKRRKKSKSGAEIPLWVWGALAGTFLLLMGLVSAALIHAGYTVLLIAFAAGLAVGLVVSTVILVISMFIASALLGGIDFGEAHVAIPKAAALLFVV